MANQDDKLSQLRRRDFLRLFSRSALILTMLLSISLLAGCGGGGGSTTTSPAQGGPVVQPNVVVLPSDGSVTITNQAADSVTLAGNVPSVVPGSVIVSGAGQGLLRKVVSTTPSGGGTIVQTQQASLEDVFQDADISVNKTLGPADFTSITPMIAGLSVSHAVPHGSTARNPKDLAVSVPLTFTHVKFPRDNPAAELNGTGSITLSFDTAISIHHFQLQTVRWVPHLAGTLDVKLSSSASVKFAEAKVLLAHLEGKPFDVQVGPVPVVFVPKIDLYATMGGNVSAGVTLTSSASVAADAGVEYDQSSGWQPVTQISRTLDLVPTLSAYASASYDFTPLRTEFTLYVYDIAGPYVALDMPKLNATVTAHATPPSADVSVSGDIAGEAGFHVQIFKLDVDYHTPALSAPFEIYHNTFVSTGAVTVGVS